MVRSLYSGVAGMVSHQTKMDVIGNNISNVSTYGYKSSRATFRDVYYQTNNTAMAATPTSGGTNPTQIGYGAKLGSVDVNHSQSVMSTTGYTLDVAIAGEGYLQVMDADGNIFYTKAGMLDIDAEGNLVDINGYFVLGVSGQPTGQKPGSDKIKVDLPYESAAAAKAEDTVNDITYTIAAENQNEDGNVNIVFAASNNLPHGQAMSAKITSASIIVTVNADAEFDGFDDFNREMNLAITSANGGVEHKAGYFTVTPSVPEEQLFSVTNADGDIEARPLTGAQIVEADFGVDTGEVQLNDAAKQYFSIKSVGDEFSATGLDAETSIEFSLSPDDFDASDDAVFVFTIGEYSGQIPMSQVGKAGTVLMTRGGDASSADSFVLSYPNLERLRGVDIGNFQVTSAKESTPSRNLGLANADLLLTGGTEGGEQTVADLTGISINDMGVIIAEHPTLGSLELGRIDLATFANPAGLSQVGDTYFAESRNSGEPIVTVPGTEGTGNILGGTLETSNTDLAHEMADMITTQRGFQACSRMITVSDTMLEELINLKR